MREPLSTASQMHQKGRLGGKRSLTGNSWRASRRTPRPRTPELSTATPSVGTFRATRAQGEWRATRAGAIRFGDLKLLEFFETGKRKKLSFRSDPLETHWKKLLFRSDPLD